MTESSNTPPPPDASEGGDTFEEQPGSGTFQRHPTDKEPRGNPEVDEDAFEKSKENLDRISPH